MPNRISKDYVPSADATTNLQERDVVGNKTDAAAAGAVSTTESLMAYAKQNVTNTEAAAVSIGVIDGYHDVPTKDAATDTVMRDVIGRKTDTAAAGPVSEVESLVAYAKQNVTNTEAIATNVTTIVSATERILDLATAALPQTGSTNLYAVTGMVEVLSIVGMVTVQIGAVANLTKLVANGNDLCTTVDVTGAAVGTALTITGTFANAMILATGGSWEAQASSVVVGTGNITVNCAGSDGGGGRVAWSVLWRPLSAGSTLVAA